jgi:hypothetical protein
MSLVTTPTHQLVACVACKGIRVTHISMTLTDGSVVDFESCHSCEHKTWTESGTDVLKKAKKEKQAA